MGEETRLGSKVGTKFNSAIAELFQRKFLRERTVESCFATNLPNGDHEIADALIPFPNFTILIQNKIRVPHGLGYDHVKECQWIDDAIDRIKAQFKKAYPLIKSHADFKAIDQLGVSIDVDFQSSAEVIFIGIIQPHPNHATMLPRKSIGSNRIELNIHLLSVDDLICIFNILITPHEIEEYLRFRFELIQSYPNEVRCLTESAIVGQYVSGKHGWIPETGFEKQLAKIDPGTEARFVFDMIYDSFDHIEFDESSSYRLNVLELSTLKRQDLKEIFNIMKPMVSKDSGNADTMIKYMSSTGLGLLFLSVSSLVNAKAVLLELLRKFKYQLKLDCAAGVAIHIDANNEVCMLWIGMNQKWMKDPQMDKLIKAQPLEINIEYVMRPMFPKICNREAKYCWDKL